jgi:hypothetical protein
VTWITRNDVNDVSFFHLPYLITLMVNCVHKGHQTSKSSILCLIVDLPSICAKYRLETWLYPNDDISKCLFDMKHTWTKNAFWDLNNKKWRKWCKFDSHFLFNIIYGLPVSQWTLIVYIKYFILVLHVFFVSLVDLRSICAKYCLETWFAPNEDIRKCLIDMKQGWNKKDVLRLEYKKWRKWFVCFIFLI